MIQKILCKIFLFLFYIYLVTTEIEVSINANETWEIIKTHDEKNILCILLALLASLRDIFYISISLKF